MVDTGDLLHDARTTCVTILLLVLVYRVTSRAVRRLQWSNCLHLSGSAQIAVEQLFNASSLKPRPPPPLKLV